MCPSLPTGFEGGMWDVIVLIVFLFTLSENGITANPGRGYNLFTLIGLGLACKGHSCHTKNSTLAKIFTEKNK